MYQSFLKKLTLRTILLLALCALLNACGIIARKTILNGLKKDIEQNDYPFPYHLFNADEYENFIGKALPVTKPYLNNRLTQKIEEYVEQRYPHRLQAAREGITSTEQLINYLEATGLLEEIEMSRQQVQQQLPTEEALQSTRLKPVADHVRFMGAMPPPAPVRYAAEYEPISATLVSFPIYYPSAWKAHADLIATIADEIRVIVAVPNEHWQQGVLLYLQAHDAFSDNVLFSLVPTDDVWVRDYGPTTVLAGSDQQPVLLWNKYHETYQPHRKLDADFGLNMGRYLDMPVYRLPLIVEGGNFLTDGEGTMVMFNSVLYHNPDQHEDLIKQTIRQYFGCERLLLFPALAGELTGHIDMVVKFVDVKTVLVAEAYPTHRWHHDFEAIADRLASTQSATGSNYRVIRVPIANTKKDDTNFYSYVNSLIVNRKVIVPTFARPLADSTALSIYRQAFPDKTMLGIDFSRHPVGAIHCQTKDIPAKSTIAFP